MSPSLKNSRPDREANNRNLKMRRAPEASEKKMTHSVKQALIHYLEFLKESGYLYAEGGVTEPAAPARPSAAQPSASPAPEARPSAPARPTPAEARPQARTHQSAPSRAAAKAVTTPQTPAAPPQAAPPAHPAIPAGPLGREERLALLADGAARAQACRACPLGSQRTQAVYYDGDPMAKIVFVGEGPGFQEDQQGKPFVGPAGQKLNKMIASIGFKREEVFICNTVKCRPTQGNKDRPPLPAEKAACEHFLLEQIAIVRPQILVALGAQAAQYLCQSTQGIGQLRGKWHTFRGIPVIATFHPSFLLRKEREADGKTFTLRAFEDLKMLHARYSELNPDDPRQLWTKKEKSE
jgi:DNA polymerase